MRQSVRQGLSSAKRGGAATAMVPGEKKRVVKSKEKKKNKMASICEFIA